MSNYTSQSSPPQFSLSFDGRRLAYLEARFLEIEFAINKIPKGEVTLYYPGSYVGDRSGETADAALCEPGSKIEINTVEGELLFTGWVVEQHLHWTQEGGIEIKLKFRHDLHKLTLVRRSQVFGVDKSVSDKEIVRLMFGQYDIKTAALGGMTVMHAQMVQYQCTDWCFLKTRLNANGVWLLPGVRGANVVEPTLALKPTHTLDLSTDAGDSLPAEEADFCFSATDRVAALKVSSWDIQLQKMSIESTGNLAANPIGGKGLDPARLKSLLDAPWILQHSVTMAPEEQAALAGGRLLAQYSTGVRARFRVWGTTRYEIGQTLAITGLGGHFNGTGLISGVKQEMEKGQWRTIITLGQDECCDLDAAPMPGIYGLHIGVVAEYKPDLQSWNRLRVVVPTLDLGNQPLWARFAAPYASKGSGVCFYPEAGDEVVLGFFENDPRYPVVLGAMHNPQNKAPFPPELSKGRKGVIFAKDGKPADNLNLVFDLLKKDVSLQAGVHQMTLDAKGIGLATDGTQPISLKSNAGIKLDGGTEVAIKGAKVDLSN